MGLTPFAYIAPNDLSEVIENLSRYTLDAKIIAGGQSLIPILKFHMANPAIIVDLRNIEDLTSVPRMEGDTLIIPAMTPYAHILSDPLVSMHAPLLKAAVGGVADRQVRRLGTIGGTCAHADPAGDALSALLALEAEFVIQGPGDRRTVPAEGFFLGFLEPDLSPEEVLVEIRIPSTAGWTAHYEKAQRTAQAWATAAVGVSLHTNGDVVDGIRIGLCNVASTPIRASTAERDLIGQVPSDDIIEQAGWSAAERTSPTSDTFASAEYRTHLARVLTQRAVRSALSQIPGQHHAVQQQAGH